MRSVDLAFVDREDARPDDLGHVRAFVQTEAKHAGDERRDDRVGVTGHQLRTAERNAERWMRIDGGEEVPKQDLDEHRRAAKEPDVDPARA